MREQLNNETMKTATINNSKILFSYIGLGGQYETFYVNGFDYYVRRVRSSDLMPVKKSVVDNTFCEQNYMKRQDILINSSYELP